MKQHSDPTFQLTRIQIQPHAPPVQQKFGSTSQSSIYVSPADSHLEVFGVFVVDVRAYNRWSDQYTEFTNLWRCVGQRMHLYRPGLRRLIRGWKEEYNVGIAPRRPSFKSLPWTRTLLHLISCGGMESQTLPFCTKSALFLLTLIFTIEGIIVLVQGLVAVACYLKQSSDLVSIFVG